MWTVKDILVCVIILSYTCFDVVCGHVVLTFPPARKYAFDFMDNIRTPRPCGVPKGLGPLTDLKSGKRINVTWHIAYPHRGGYRISLLDAKENVIQQYQNTFINSNNPTTLQQEITLPTTSCLNCTLQLVRQAAEWGSNCDNNQYLFWSCADINIHTNTTTDSQLCNGNPSVDGKCICNSPYSGDHCQYKDECQYDSDCNNGKCLNTESTYFPKKQCYCSSGWFGTKCDKRSPIQNDNVDYSLYINTTLSPEYQLYHRVLKELNEIEVIMRVKSQTWVGLGWRPANLKSGCQYFPNLPGVIPRPEPEPEKSTTKPEPEPHSCGGKVSACPSGQCLAHLMWTFDEKTDVITFQIDAAIEENQWLGLGLSKDTAMVNTDIYTGWYTNGVAYIQDRYASAKREPPIDQTQNIFNISASRNNGRTFLTFSRKRNTGDSSDEAFSDTECLYPLFAWGPVTSLSSLSIGYHSFRYNGVTEKLCIKSCPPQTSTTKPEPEPEKTTITPEPEPEKSTSEPEPEPYLCTGKVSACPSGQCVAHLMWTFDEKTDMITFQIDAAIEENQWLGLGLSKDTAMIKTDIYTGWYTNGVAYIQDRYASAKREPPIDQTQNIFNISASRNNGRTFLTFSRKRNTDDSSDEAFSDTECLYPLFAWGPVTSLSSLSIGYHSFRYNGVTEKLCIKSCSPQTSTTKPVPEPEKTTIAPAPEPEKSTTKPEPEPSLCTGKVSACPSGQCVAHLMWTFDEKTDMITFQIDAAIEENQWLGLGLSKDTSMTNTDIYTGWYTNGVTNVQDRYASAKREPPIDAIQNIFNVSGKRENGRTFLTFSRQRNTGDSSDEIFSDTQCLYPLFAWGPVTSFSSRTIGYHAFRYNGVTEKLCIKSCSNVSPEPEKPTSEPETTGEPEGEGEPGSCGAPPRGFNDTTGDSPHPMDCVDMVIGSAKGQLSRIGDYYSRDRSTPQKDEFYGGKDDLTAAYGFEDSNGYTTIMFRKKLRADERSDFSFLNEYMHVIWARGQEPGKFHHLPNVGLAENELSSFYKHDELKYHGHGGQRGIRRINFLDEPSGPVVGNCTQTWRNPSDNTHEVTWQYDSTTDSVQFTLKARLLQRQWIGVGISRDTFMPNTDTIVGWVNDDKTVTLIDGWASGRSVPATDTVQDVQGVRGTIENGITTISFNRRRDTQDQNDIAFSQNECVHLIYAKGGDYAVETGRFGYHDTTPIVSSGKICIPCPTVRPVEKFWVPYVFKLLGLLWQEVYNDANSAEFKKLKSDMESSLKNKFQRVNGFQKALVQKFSPGSINVNGVVEIQSDDQLQSKTEVSTELQNIVQEGRLSGYTVDSTQGSYKVGDPEPVKEVTAAPPSTDEKPILTETVWIIIGVGAGGLLLVLILGTCNCIRIHKNKKTQYTDERTKMYRNGFFQNDQSSSQEEPAKSDSMKYMDWRNMTHDMSQNQGPRTQNHYENPSYMPDVQTGKPPSYYYGYKIETYVNNE